jgi:hypothetical protein
MQASSESGRFFSAYPRLAATIVLWLASTVFVTAFANVSKWVISASGPCVPALGNPWQPCEYHHMADLCRWDCLWFATVVESGYDRTPGRQMHDRANWLFHPVLPLAAYPLHRWFGISTLNSLVLVGRAAFFLCIYAFLLMLSSVITTDSEYLLAGALIAFNPYLLYGHTGYSEPFYFAFLCLAFYLAERQRWITSGAMAALVSAARMVGFIFAISYVIYAFRWWRAGSGTWKRMAAPAIGLLLCPLGTSLYMLYLYRHTGDAMAHVHIHLAWTASPITNPFTTLKTLLLAHHWWRLWGVMSIGSLVAGLYLLKLGKPEYGLYLLLSTLIALAGGVLGVPRYLWWQPPLLYAIYVWLRRHPVWWVPYLATSAGLASLMIVQWFSGRDFVV